MKRSASLILSLVYLLASVGVMVNVHYCGGKVMDVKLFSAVESCCGDEEPKSLKCCHEENLVFQLDDEQTVSHSLFELNDLQPMALIPILFVLDDGDDAKMLKIGVELDRPPPDGPPSWLLHCSPLHYG